MIFAPPYSSTEYCLYCERELRRRGCSFSSTNAMKLSVHQDPGGKEHAECGHKALFHHVEGCEIVFIEDDELVSVYVHREGSDCWTKD